MKYLAKDYGNPIMELSRFVDSLNDKSNCEMRNIPMSSIKDILDAHDYARFEEIVNG